MEKVLGIGGFFFRARDPQMLAQWYAEHLGIAPPSAESEPWSQEPGETAFTPFDRSDEYFGVDRAWMLNFRVRDLDAMAKQLRSAGIDVAMDSEQYPYGRFARIHDPEGNPIELWEPA